MCAKKSEILDRVNAKILSQSKILQQGVDSTAEIILSYICLVDCGKSLLLGD